MCVLCVCVCVSHLSVMCSVTPHNGPLSSLCTHSHHATQQEEPLPLSSLLATVTMATSAKTVAKTSFDVETDIVNEAKALTRQEDFTVGLVCVDDTLPLPKRVSSLLGSKNTSQVLSVVCYWCLVFGVCV